MALKRRKIAMSITIEPEMVEFINNTVQGTSFSNRISVLIHEWITFKNALVIYEDETQFKTGNPTKLNPNAERIYSCSSFFYGWDIVNCSYVDQLGEIFDMLNWKIKKLPKSERLVIEKFLPLVREKGFDVQIIDEPENDVYDVWIAEGFSPANANCAKCKHLINLREYIDNAMEDVEENVILNNLANIYEEKLYADTKKMVNDKITNFKNGKSY